MATTQEHFEQSQGESLDMGHVTVGELLVCALEAAGVRESFGVISLHNMPILDAIGRRGAFKFVPSRGEAGAVNMADAAARVTGRLSVAITSTGTGAGNACGALIEALTAGTPMIHLTGQIDRPYLDRGWGFIHEAVAQPATLASVSKAFYRIQRPEEAESVIQAAIQTALTAPTGPVSIEIPIDVQKAMIHVKRRPLLKAPFVLAPEPASLDRLAELVRGAKRPLIWLGGGACAATASALRLANMGIGIVTSVRGRGTLSEAHAMSLAAFTTATPVLELYARCDLMVVVGSHLRSNETTTYSAPLPERLVRIDVDPMADGRGYAGMDFIAGDARLALDGLADRLGDSYAPDDGFREQVSVARAQAEIELAKSMGIYTALRDAIAAAMPDDGLWVRDVTLSNSIWGNRSPIMTHPQQAVHAAGGGIGQGLPHGIGAAVASGRKTITLVGDGGLTLCLGELGTLAETAADMVLIVMNDRGYGVIRNIQDAAYGGRRMYTDLRMPSFAKIADSFGLSYKLIDDAKDFGAALAEAVAAKGPVFLEVDMIAIGEFGINFAGPPEKKKIA
jgi:acetolactate synthase-1/2/3 large subunit